MAITEHRILSLVLLCIVTVIIYTDDINGTPIKRPVTVDCYIDLDYDDSHKTQLLENITSYVGQAFPEVTDLLQDIASSQNSANAEVLPGIVNFLEEDKIVQSSQNQLIANSLTTVTQHLTDLVHQQNQQNSTLQQISNLSEDQSRKLDRQNQLLEEEKIIQASQNQLMANSLDTVTQHVADLIQQQNSSLQQISNLLQDQSEKLDRQNQLLQIQRDTQQQDMVPTQTVTPPKEMQQEIITTQTVAPPIEDCTGVLQSGQYTISPPNNALGSFPVYCDIDNNGDGWVVFQRRFDGSVDFERNWVDYERGFGSLDGEFWLGLEKLHVLTSGNSSRYQLLVELQDFSDNRVYALYNDFKVGDSASFYRIPAMGSFSGTAGDGMRGLYSLNGSPFTTKDQDNDESEFNCARVMRSGWWHSKTCTHANVNGVYMWENARSSVGMHWTYWKKTREVLKKTELKIRLIA